MKHAIFTKIIASVFVIAAFTACSKKLKTEGCPTGQMCTMEFAALTVNFVDKAGNAVTVKSVKVLNLRTNVAILAQGMGSMVSQAGRYVFVTDGNKKQLSTEGDDLKITATNAATNKMVTAIVKVSGGCNCHVSKVSGADNIVFE
jgi:DNA-binding beta-propeller fold protein YncE